MSDDLRDWLDDHIDLEKRGAPSNEQGPPPVAAPNLSRIRQLVELLGRPHEAYPVVHVTGTNGKSSTARMIASLLAARGLGVGLYTSPHLTHLNERIARNGQALDDDSLSEALDAVRRVEPLMDERPSFFEIVTAAGFWWFADVAVDVAVLEVGLGGTWDATNVADADVAVVTNVGVDHVEYLGPTRDAIAKEKAGIVKDGSTLILGETDPELVPIFTGAGRVAATALRERDFGVTDNVMAHNGRLVTIFTPGGEYEDVFVPLHGAHQADNAAAALAAAEAFFGGDRLDLGVVAAAFESVEVPGRLEVVGRQPLVVLDGAHNVAGADALRVALAEEFAGEARTLVVGLLREKEPHEMLEALGVPGEVERLVVCRPPTPRGLDPEVLAAAALNLGMPKADIEVADEVPEAIARALADVPAHGQVVVAGSLYTVGAARSVLVA